MATIGALVYKLGLDVSELSSNVKSVESKLSPLGGMAGKVGVALGGMLAIGGVAQAVSAYTEFTGRIADLATQTGMSTTAVQKLDFAAKQSGGSFDQVASGIAQMANRLVEGDKSAVQGLKTLGLSFDQVRQMGPDQAFMTIADAIAKVPNPLEQSKLAMDVFGKSGAQLLPMIKNGLSETAAEAEQLGLVLSEDAIAAGDQFGDTLDKLKLVGMSLISSVLTPLVPVLVDIATAVGKAAHALGPVLTDIIRALISWTSLLVSKLLDVAATAAELAMKVGGPLAAKLGINSELVQGLKASAQSYADLSSKQWALVGSAEQAAPAVTKMAAAIRTTAPASKEAVQALEAFRKKVDDATGLSAYKNALDAMRVIEAAGARIDPTKFLELATEVQAGVEAAFRLGLTVDDAMLRVATGASEARAATEGLKGALQGVSLAAEQIRLPSTALPQNWLGELPTGPKGLPPNASVFSGLFKGFLGSGGLIASQAQSIVKQDWAAVAGSVGSGLGTNAASGSIGKALTGFLGKTLGGLANSALPILGGLGIQRLGKVFGGLFGGNEHAKADKAATSSILSLQAELLKTHGSLAEIDRLGKAVGVDLAGAWGDRSQAGLKHFQTLLDEFTAKVGASRTELATLQSQLADRSVMDWERAEEIITKYGGTLGTLGQSFEAAKQAANWKTVWDDWQTLIDMGADVGGVLESMKDEIGHLVTESVRIGTEIPAQFQPLVEELIRTGQLFDDSGTAITDISTLKFGAPLVSEVDKIIAKIDELIQALSGPNGVSAAIQEIPDRVHVKVGVDWDVPALPAGATGGVYHTGGLVSSAGRFTGASAVPWSAMRLHTGGDVPAWLQSGEYVVSRRGVQAIGLATLEQWNAGRRPASSGAGPSAAGDPAWAQALVAEVQALRRQQLGQDATFRRAVRDAVLLAR